MAAKFKIAWANGPGGSWPKTWNILVNSFCREPGEKLDMDITRWREDMDFIFEWWKQYFTNERNKSVKYCFHQKKIKFISSSHRVIFIIYVFYYIDSMQNLLTNLYYYILLSLKVWVIKFCYMRNVFFKPSCRKPRYNKDVFI